MKKHNSRLFRFGISLLGFVTVAMVLWGQGQGQGVSHNRIPLAEDWSHRHVIFSNPTSAQQEYQIKQQYRYWNQWFRRNVRVQMSAVDKAQFTQAQRQEEGIAFSGVPNRNDEGSGGEGGAAGSSTVMTIPTTARSAVPAAPSRQQRPWTIYGIRLLLAALFLLALALKMKETWRRRLAFGLALGLVAAFLAPQIGCAGGNSAGTPQLVTPQSLQRDWGTPLTANATVGEGMYPAKFTFDITAAPSCTNDFVVFTTGLSGGGTTVDIIAYNQLYTGTGGICSGGPSVLWAYQTTSNAGGTVTSPVLSLDGTQVAYMEGNGGTGVLHILRPGTGANAGTLSAPVTPPISASAALYNTCKATLSNVCLFNISFGNAADDSFSAPFYDYASDMLYAGDNGGNLHRFTGVFKGSPSETPAPWPIAVHSTHRLLSPVKDHTSGNIFVTDVDGTLSYVREANISVGACGSGSPPCLGSATVTLSTFLPPPNVVSDPPIVDSTQGRVFAFTGHGSTPGLRGANVFQADTALAGVIDLDIGQGDRTNLHIGAFDNAYFSSVGTGHLYVCANSGANGGSGDGAPLNNQPTLKRISFNPNGTMNSVDAGTLTLTPLTPVPTAFTTCSPVTEVLSGGTDRIFMSVQALGPGGCSGNGCVISVSIPTTSPFTFPAAVTALLPEPGGTSGIVIDNVSSAGQASSIYFTILLNSTTSLTCNAVSGVGCAVKATQSGLN